jgi:hypothetical protein
VESLGSDDVDRRGESNDVDRRGESEDGDCGGSGDIFLGAQVLLQRHGSHGDGDEPYGVHGPRAVSVRNPRSPRVIKRISRDSHENARRHSRIAAQYSESHHRPATALARVDS